MSEERLQVFIDAVVRYFTHMGDSDVDVGTPYLVENEEPQVHDYTGVIGISGNNNGCVYFTAPTVLLKNLVLSLGETNLSRENLVDAVGEVANTVSGNARKQLGKDFMISVPIVVEGAPSESHLPHGQRSYVIPITWKSYKAAVAICLKH